MFHIAELRYMVYQHMHRLGNGTTDAGDGVAIIGNAMAVLLIEMGAVTELHNPVECLKRINEVAQRVGAVHCGNALLKNRRREAPPFDSP